MKYSLILNGSGFIGANLVREFVTQGKNVIVLDVFKGDGRFDDIFDQIIIFDGRLGDINLLNDIFSQYEIEEVVHLVSSLIPSSTLEDFIFEHSNVILPTIELIEIMIKKNVRKLIYLSSGGTVYGNYKKDGNYNENDSLKPINYYGLSKCNLEEIITFEGRKGNIDYLILRPSNPFGRFQNIHGKQGLIAVVLGKLLEGEELEIWGDGHSVRDYIPVEKLCQYISEINNSNVKNEIYNVGSGIGFSINEIIELVEKTLSLKLRKNYISSRNVDSDKLILNIGKMKNVIDIEEIDFCNSIFNFYNFLLEDRNGK